MHPDYQLLIFDWDGTLADSIGRIVESMHISADRSGFPRRDDFAVKGIIGLPANLFYGTGIPEKCFNFFHVCFIGYFRFKPNNLISWAFLFPNRQSPFYR